jgi:hypothetical protein
MAGIVTLEIGPTVRTVKAEVVLLGDGMEVAEEGHLGGG